MQQIENGKKKAHVCWEFGVVNLEDRTKIISVLEQNGLRINWLWKPGQSDISEALLKCFKGERNDNASVIGPILMITLILHYVFFSVNLYGNLQ